MNWTKWQIYISSPNIPENFLPDGWKLELFLFYCWLLIKINHPVLKTCFCYSVLGTKIIFTLTVNISQLLLSLNHLCLSKTCIIVTQTSNCNCKQANPKLKVHYSHNRRQVEAFHNDTEFPFWVLLIFNLLWPEVSWQTDTIDWFLCMCVNDSPFHPLAPNCPKLALTMVIFRK